VLIPEITVDELLQLQADGDVRLVDVREDNEWIDSHIESAVHVALATVPDHLDAFGDNGADEPTYVICKVGGRSYRACEYAAAQGKNVVNVAGGMMAWWAGGQSAVSGH
jgi:rhodanese-related sulfurtransferase